MHASLHTPCMPGACRGHKATLELELPMVVSQTQVLCKTSDLNLPKGSLLRSRQSRLYEQSTDHRGTQSSTWTHPSPLLHLHPTLAHYSTNPASPPFSLLHREFTERSERVQASERFTVNSTVNWALKNTTVHRFPPVVLVVIKLNQLLPLEASELQSWKVWEAKRPSWSACGKFLHRSTADTLHASTWLSLHRKADQSEREQKTKWAMTIARFYGRSMAIFRTQGTEVCLSCLQDYFLPRKCMSITHPNPAFTKHWLSWLNNLLSQNGHSMRRAKWVQDIGSQ